MTCSSGSPTKAHLIPRLLREVSLPSNKLLDDRLKLAKYIRVFNSGRHRVGLSIR